MVVQIKNGGTAMGRHYGTQNGQSKGEETRRSRKAARRAGQRREAAAGGPSGLLVPLPLTWGETVALMQDAVHSFAVELGQHVATRLLEEEVERLCGPKHSRQSGRAVSRHGHQAGFVV